MSDPSTHRSAAKGSQGVGYDALAGPYRWLEWIVFGNRLQAARFASIDELPREGLVLVLGDGDGRLLSKLAWRRPHCRFVSVDQSRGMLRAQRRRVAVSDRSRVTWIHADARKLAIAPETIDVMVMPFFLDCFDEPTLRQHLPVWLNMVKPGGLVLHVDFATPDLWWHRVAFAPLSMAMHLFFQWTTGLSHRGLIDVAPMFREQGWTIASQRKPSGPFLVSTLWTRR